MHFIKLTIIECYALTIDSNDDIKDAFFLKYTSFCNNKKTTPKHDTLIVMGDFNAKLGDNNETVKKHYGKIRFRQYQLKTRKSS
jgi:hypothetical protein